jgi:hypothetical protein
MFYFIFFVCIATYSLTDPDGHCYRKNGTIIARCMEDIFSIKSSAGAIVIK